MASCCEYVPSAAQSRNVWPTPSKCSTESQFGSCDSQPSAGFPFTSNQPALQLTMYPVPLLQAPDAWGNAFVTSFPTVPQLCASLMMLTSHPSATTPFASAKPGLHETIL